MPTSLPLPVALLERRLGLPEGSLDGPDKARAEDNISDATALALAEAPASVAEAWQSDVPDVVKVVILKAARREFENPRGAESEGLGEHNVGGLDTSGVYLTGREIAQVRRAATGRARFVGSIRTPAAFENI